MVVELTLSALPEKLAEKSHKTAGHMPMFPEFPHLTTALPDTRNRREFSRQ